MRSSVVLLVGILTTGGIARAACKSTCAIELRACRTHCRDDADRRACRAQCADASTCVGPGSVFGTGAFVVNECRNDAAGFSLRERLFVRRDNCDAVQVMELLPVGPVPDPAAGLFGGLGFCDLWSQYRVGWGSVIVGRFQRIGVLPNGKAAVVEVTNNHVVHGYEPLSPEPPDEGIYLVSADGRRTKRLGPPSARHIIEGTITNFALTGSPYIAVSPNSRFVAFEDRGPGPDGRDADQIAVIDLATGERRLVTMLANAPAGSQRTANPAFVNDHTILFYNGEAAGRFTVRVDGGDLRAVPDTSVTPGGVILDFRVAGPGGNVIVGRFPGRVPKVDYGDRGQVRELFLVEATRALQLTNLGYSDTGGGVRPQVARGQAVFVASADPVTRNPDGVCQLFALDTLGRRVRQLTSFPPDGRQRHGCGGYGPRFSCDVSGLAVDARTGGLLFSSSCDPLGRNPDGEQFFTMRSDGSGLRQISSFRGVERTADAVHVEMPGPAASSAVIR